MEGPALEAIIEGANCDVRQVLNNLQMWSRTSKTMSYDGVKDDVKSAIKETTENPFTYASRFFTAHFHNQSLDDRINVYFNDYQMSPLFAQELYVVVPVLTLVANSIVLHVEAFAC